MTLLNRSLPRVTEYHPGFEHKHLITRNGHPWIVRRDRPEKFLEQGTFPPQTAAGLEISTRAELELEIIALRHQVAVLHRQQSGRLHLCSIDRMLWVWLYRVWPRCLEAMVLVKPSTVVQCHRQGSRLYWRWRSRSGRKPVDRETRKLIRQMCLANPLWGAPRIHGELLKLGIKISQATVRRRRKWRSLKTIT